MLLIVSIAAGAGQTTEPYQFWNSMKYLLADYEKQINRFLLSKEASYSTQHKILNFTPY